MHYVVVPRVVAAGLALVLLGYTSVATVSGMSAEESEPTTTAAATGGQWYTVRSGDTLSRIAQSLGVDLRSLVDANRITNPNHIIVGQRLWVPAPDQPEAPGEESAAATPTAAPDKNTLTYVVVAGDTLSAIARRYDVPLAALVELNAIRNANLIRIGQRLQIPVKQPGNPTAAQTAAATSAASPTAVQQKVSPTAAGSSAPATEAPQPTSTAPAPGTTPAATSSPAATGTPGRTRTPSPQPTAAPERTSTASPTPTPAASSAEGAWYTVAGGDTLSHIAARFGVSVSELCRVNQISNPNVIRVGQRLQIPSASPVPQIPRPTASAAATAVPTRPTAVASPTASQTASETVSPTATRAAPSATPTRAPVAYEPASFGYGMTISVVNGSWMTQAIEAVVAAGFKWVRLEVPWAEIEPVRQGAFEWSRLDALMERLSAAKLKVLVNITDGPDWTRAPGASLEVKGPPASPLDMAVMITALVDRYRGKLHAVEVWSGQNEAYEWGYEPLDAGRYTQLLCAVYSAVKAVDPSVAVISGGLTPTGVTAEGISIDDVEYLRQMYAAGCRSCMDGLGAHPAGYNNPPDVRSNYTNTDEPTYKAHRSFFFQETLLAYRSLMQEFGDSGKRIWVTEVGWASSTNPLPGYMYAADVTTQEQAEYLVKAYRMMRDWGWVGPAFCFNLNYSVTYPLTGSAHFAIWQRPAYEALRRLEK